MPDAVDNTERARAVAIATRATFSQFFDAGFGGEVIPIVPPGARLSPKSGLSESDLGKIPGAYWSRHRAWTGLRDWAGAKFTALSAEAWDAWPEPNVGLRAARFPGIDVDVADEALVAAIVALAFETIGPAPVRHRQGSARVLLPYRLATGEPPVKKHRVVCDAGAVEILGFGQQYVVQGTHPKGGRYCWTGGTLLKVGAAGLAPIDRARCRAFVERASALVGERRCASTIGGGGSGDPIADKSVDPLQLMREGAREGDRNNAAARLFGYLLRYLDSATDAVEFVRHWNQQLVTPPLGDAELETIMTSVARRELKRRTGDCA